MIDKKNLLQYFVLIVVSTILTICDLAVSMNKLLIASLVISSITMIIGFVGKYKTKFLKIDDNVDDTIKFIKSNFSRSSLILSVLDVLCCVLALLTGFFIIAVISRGVLALRLVIIINKYKAVAFCVWSFVFMYLIKRGSSKMEEEKLVENAEIDKVEKKPNVWVKIKDGIVKAFKYVFVYNPQASSATVFNALVSGLTGYAITLDDFGVEFWSLKIGGFDIIPLLISICVFVLVELLGIRHAFEKSDVAKDRIEREDALKTEKKTLKMQARAERQKEKKDAEKLEKARALVLQRKKDAEQKAAEDAETAEIEALARQIEAQEKNK